MPVSVSGANVSRNGLLDWTGGPLVMFHQQSRKGARPTGVGAGQTGHDDAAHVQGLPRLGPPCSRRGVLCGESERVYGRFCMHNLQSLRRRQKRTGAAQDVKVVRPANQRRARHHDGARPVRVQVEAGPLRVALRLDLDACGANHIDWGSLSQLAFHHPAG